MKRENLVAGLNLGTTKTCAVIAEAVVDDATPGAKVLGLGLAKTSGVKRGKVRDIEETTRSIVRAMRDAERMAGVQVPVVYCGIAGELVRTQVSTGLASVTGDEITRQDAERVEDVAKAVTLGDGYELLHYIPQEYKVDSQGGISDPVGMVGLRLEVGGDRLASILPGPLDVRSVSGARVLVTSTRRLTALFPPLDH